MINLLKSHWPRAQSVTSVRGHERHNVTVGLGADRGKLMHICLSCIHDTYRHTQKYAYGTEHTHCVNMNHEHCRHTNVGAAKKKKSIPHTIHSKIFSIFFWLSATLPSDGPLKADEPIMNMILTFLSWQRVGGNMCVPYEELLDAHLRRAWREFGESKFEDFTQAKTSFIDR